MKKKKSHYYTPTTYYIFFGKGGLFRMNQRHTAPAESSEQVPGAHAAHHTRHGGSGTEKRVTSTWCGKDAVQTVRGEDSGQEARFWSGLARL